MSRPATIETGQPSRASERSQATRVKEERSEGSVIIPHFARMFPSSAFPEAANK